MRELRGRLTYANAMATIAVFIALGGTSYAISKLPKNSVGTKQLKKNAVTTPKIKNGAVTAAKIKDGAITGAKIQDGAITGAKIQTSSLGTVPTAANANALDGRAASSFAPAQAEPLHVVGASGEVPFVAGWGAYGGSSLPA